MVKSLGSATSLKFHRSLLKRKFDLKNPKSYSYVAGIAWLSSPHLNQLSIAISIYNTTVVDKKLSLSLLYIKSSSQSKEGQSEQQMSL